MKIETAHKIGLSLLNNEIFPHKEFISIKDIEISIKKYFLNINHIRKDGKITLSKEYFEEFCKSIGVVSDEVLNR